MNVDDLVNYITRLTDPEFQELFTKLKELQPLQTMLETIPEDDRMVTLKRIQTFAERDRVVVAKDNRSTPSAYVPKYSKFDFVDCYFTGMGFEWDAKHIALVWDVYPHLDSIMVIPTTSKPRKSSKNILSLGTIPGLWGGETTLLIGDMTRVSRKRLEPLTPYRHPKKGLIPVRLPVGYQDQILWAIVTTYANETTFEEVLKFKTSVAMVDDLKSLNEERFKAVRSTFDLHTNILEYRTWNKDQVKQIKLIMPKIPLIKETKIRLIDDLFSEDEDMRIRAEADYYHWYHYNPK